MYCHRGCFYWSSAGLGVYSCAHHDSFLRLAAASTLRSSLRDAVEATLYLVRLDESPSTMDPM